MKQETLLYPVPELELAAQLVELFGETEAVPQTLMQTPAETRIEGWRINGDTMALFLILVEQNDIGLMMMVKLHLVRSPVPIGWCYQLLKLLRLPEH